MIRRLGAWLRLVPMALAPMALAGTLAFPPPAPAQADDRRPVRVVAEGRLAVSSPQGPAVLPVELSANWSRPLYGVNRVVVMLHGTLRNADAYLRAADQAREQAGALAATTLLVVPQFLADVDVQAHHLPPEFLRWDLDGWKQGSPARGPAPLSSFDALDALLARLADTSVLPMLRDVVVAGHSAGAQVAQRYAAVGRGDSVLMERGIRVRYVVANPSSYLWFGPDRPRPAPPGTCVEVDRWKYGLSNAPPYVTDPDTVETRYLSRDVVYLLGEADTDPAHKFLDRSCAALAQGENRYARGMQFRHALEQRHPNLVRHRIFALPGVGHDAARVFASPCGIAALFGRDGCVGL